MSQPNILLITVDDMNWDAVGAFGCPTKDTTPHIDQMARDGICFNYGHVTIAVCQPSRSAWMTGRYPHRSGGEGFYRLRQPDVPLLPEQLRANGYGVGILGKVVHSTPHEAFEWDMTYDMDDLGHGRDPVLYGRYCEEFIRQNKQADRPFFLMLNSHDPHRPFYGNDRPEWYDPEVGPVAAEPSRTFSPNEVEIPGFLIEHPDVRLEISEYYNSVRRCDDTIGTVMAALRAQGCEENTIVVFMSDNGMAFPYAKTNCYLHSTRTPWIMKWPETIASGRWDHEHFVSGIDLMPTLLDAAGIAVPDGVDGRSFLPLLRGEKQEGREHVFTQFHQTAGRRNYPMRCIQNRRFGYIFNPWSDGKRCFRNESQQGRTMKAMKNAAEQDPHAAARVQLFLYRVPEEFYDFENDPDALNNLIDAPEYATELAELQSLLEAWMVANDDPALRAFCNRHAPDARATFMAETAEAIGQRDGE